MPAPSGVDGMSWLPIAQRREASWRDSLLYEYFWERNYPMTPTIHALRGDRYKFVRCHGLHDIDELYDIQEDPEEMNNLIFSQQHQEIAEKMRSRLWDILEETGGMQMPLYRDTFRQFNHREPSKSHAADFPDELYDAPKPKTDNL